MDTHVLVYTITKPRKLPMLRLNIYLYIEDNNFQFHKTQKALAKKMNVLHWLVGSYQEEIIERGENLLDMMRHHLPVKAFQSPSIIDPKPLVAVHPCNPS